VRRVWVFWAVFLAAAGACTASTSAPTTPSAATASPPPSLPSGLPPSFGDDVGAGDVPAAALIPLGADVTGSWDASTSAGEAIVVAWSVPGSDPFQLERGIVAWRRFEDGGAPWRPVWGQRYPPRREPLQNLTGQIADLTADGSDDALVLAETGGSGGCATVSVIDLATGTRAYRSSGCDRTVEPSSDPVGLTIREAVFAPGDAHCCPSRVRTTVLVDNGGSWQPASSTTERT
jgi:hypothetical protein